MSSQASRQERMSAPISEDEVKRLEAKYMVGDPNSAENKKKFREKQPSQFVDPCSEASKAAMKCLDRNDYDKSLCGSYFAAVRECKKIWLEERKREKREASKVW
ncbi:hypothetical protein SAICODRAFT_31160 [Saitoella complicata NRRL Y-17804]|uniref:uncharacterized protein n=1 Tax=Saitoella complicata (strain BCRC 22490 / CBS 7301 / JCM 7358 / NBRC 10748 / NRRL Y-17804) TaxID=698492 RepID=UPI000867903A|nr:uncharacterized protein SAICODRAFT_31160 [Saitoella complicata NRRL Y-17804]ODQ51835.1 hypothetical protein SAICODRAFT_31160 [Saitoella complicata NRRL Y-17804]